MGEGRGCVEGEGEGVWMGEGRGARMGVVVGGGEGEGCDARAMGGGLGPGLPRTSFRGREQGCGLPAQLSVAYHPCCCAHCVLLWT